MLGRPATGTDGRAPSDAPGLIWSGSAAPTPNEGKRVSPTGHRALDPQLRDSLLLSVQGGHLAVICGAGLSMSPPTCVPSAAELARICGDRYTQITQNQLPDDVRCDLERVVDYFLQLDRFREFLDFVPWETFSRNPNRGHSAIADFLCCGALTFAATTNFDTHIEDAAFELGERDFRSALDGVEAAKLPDRHRPLLKLHGCHKRDSSNTLWAPVADRPKRRDSDATCQEHDMVDGTARRQGLGDSRLLDRLGLPQHRALTGAARLDTEDGRGRRSRRSSSPAAKGT